ncbi:DUF2721 domain-containing protein [Acidisphaera sp. L21]|uniref:DUF2721 domain-containing protein n=1 Tax=Acidisphaera sp. L21 TaxID=1641851 RepID=UPI00131E3A1E|nr:DUF2721 domain-containing protein [Acidisphaera sp. L21]
MDPIAASGDVTHIIQTALAPIFLLSGIGTLLNLFNTRLARVSDHVEHITELLDAADDDQKALDLYRHLRRLSRRRLALDASVIFAGLAGACTCAAAFALFVVTLRDAAGSMVLLWVFGMALGCTIVALAAFIVDTILAWHGVLRDGPMPLAKRF